MLQDSPDMGVRGVNHVANGCLWMFELRGSGQCRLGCVEGLVHGWRPSQGLARALKRVREGDQKACSTPEKPTVEVDEPEEVLEL